ncbi:MAG: MFS transporter [Thermoprotei archaeon]
MSQQSNISKLAEVIARIDRLPVRPYPRSWLVILGVGYFFAFYDILTLSFALVSPMVKQLSLTEALISAAVSATLFGYIVGAYVISTSSDYLGRRLGLIVNLGVFSLGSLISALATSPGVLIASRFITGMGIGSEISIINSYMSEITPAGIRGRLTQWAYVAGALGFALTPFIALVLIPISPIGWRYMFGLGAVGAFAAVFLRAMLPESPRWLAVKGRVSEAETLVSHMERYTERRVGSLPPTPPPIPITGLKGYPTRELFNRKYGVRLLVLTLFWFFDYMLAYGVLGFAPYMLVAAGFLFTSAVWYIALGSLGYIVGAVSMSFIADSWERKYLVASATTVAVIGTLLYAGAVAYHSPVMLTVGAFLGAFATAFAVPAYTYTAENFPTRARASGFAVADGIGHLGGAVVPFVFLALFDPMDPATGVRTFIVFALFEVVATLIILTGPRTTKLRLEELSA